MILGLRNKVHILSILAGLLVASPQAAWSGDEGGILNQMEQEIASILEANRPSVVRIHTIYSQSGRGEGLQYGKGFTHGTGFVFDKEGHILTVDRAVRGAEEIWVTLASGFQVRASYVASDPASEVAVIQVDADNLLPVALGNSDRMRIGHYAFILGNTFGNLTPSFGVTHEIDRNQDLIHIMASVNPGFGGAPVFCSTGKVVGLVWAAPDPWSSAQEKGYSGPAVAWQDVPTTVFVLPINRVIRIAQSLVSGQQTAYGWLGVEGEYDTGVGFRVTGVLSNGPAAASGIHPGDMILSYQGQPIASGEHLRSLVLSTPPGTSVQMRIKQDDRPSTPQVQVGKRPSDPDVFADVGTSETVRPVVDSPFSRNSNPELLFQELDRLEVLRLRQQLMQPPQPMGAGSR